MLEANEPTGTHTIKLRVPGTQTPVFKTLAASDAAEAVMLGLAWANLNNLPNAKVVLVIEHTKTQGGNATIVYHGDTSDPFNQTQENNNET